MEHKTVREKLAFVRKDKFLLSLTGIAVLALTGFIFYNHYSPEWAQYQSEFRDLVEEKFGPDRKSTRLNSSHRL